MQLPQCVHQGRLHLIGPRPSHTRGRRFGADLKTSVCFETSCVHATLHVMALSLAGVPIMRRCGRRDHCDSAEITDTVSRLRRCDHGCAVSAYVKSYV